jgi:hypothetical protein
MRNALRILFVLALADPSVAAAGIAYTKHDLTSTDIGASASTEGTDRQCRYCHQVHGTRVEQGGLWAPSSRRGSARGPGSALPLVGTPLGVSTDQDGPRSQQCLSCHDGTVARNIAATGGGTASGHAGTIPGHGSKGAPHPVSAPFAGQVGSSTSVEQYGVASFTACATGVPVCVKDATLSSAGAYIKLFGRSGSYRVECSSCHDPHQDNLAGTHPHFLRVPKTAGPDSSCAGCHKK